MGKLRTILAAALVVGVSQGCVTTENAPSTKTAAGAPAPQQPVRARSVIDEAKYDENMARGKALDRDRRTTEAFDAFLAAAEAKPGDKEAIARSAVLARFVGKLDALTASLAKQLPHANEVGRHAIYSAQITAYWESLKRDELETARRRLIQLWRTSNNAEIKSQREFIRSMHLVAGGYILVTERFELTPPNAIRYVFQFIGDGRRVGDRVSLGTYDYTTNVMREIEKRPADWRMWHLDFYRTTAGGFAHETLGMYPNGEPSFESIYERAIARLTPRP